MRPDRLWYFPLSGSFLPVKPVHAVLLGVLFVIGLACSRLVLQEAESPRLNSQNNMDVYDLC